MTRRRSARFAAVAAACLAAASALAADPIVVPPADAPRPAKPQMGVNLEGVIDYARSMMFVDLMKSARRFGSPSVPWDEKAPVDEHGWPTGDAGVVVAADVLPPAGDYQFSCTGRCELGLVNTKGSVNNLTYNPQTNTTTATVTVLDGSPNIFLSFTKTSGGIKNARLLRPGYTADQMFTREFLASLAPFSTLRLMDFTRTNESEVVDWKDRATPADALQTSPKGCAWEFGIALANQAKKDLWINIPTRASDDYVRQLAKLLKDSLDKDRVVYVEYSNEVWNAMFIQSNFNLEAAKKEIAAGDKTLTEDGTDSNQYYWGWKRVSKRIVEISNLFREVFGDAAINSRIRPVLASQSAQVFMARMQVEYIDKHFGPPSKFIYGLAGAPYLSPEEKVANKDGATIDDLIKSLASNPWATNCTYQYLLLARYYRLHQLCYEGGIGIEGEQNLTVKLATNRDPRIGKVITDHFNTWYGQGGELFMYYNLCSPWGKWGAWGLTDDIRILSPKLKAVRDLLNAPTPPLTAGAAVPGVLQAGKFDVNTGGVVEDVDGVKQLAGLAAGHSFDYLLAVKTAGLYDVTIQAVATDNTPRVEPVLSGTSLGQVQLFATPNGQKFSTSEPVRVKLSPGQLVLRLNVVRGGANIRSVTFQKVGG
jgi:hypothetical protein